MTVHDKAIRLLEGGVVYIKGNWFRVSKLPDYYCGSPCVECELDSLCGEAHTDVCHECDVISGRKCFLQLVGATKARCV